jgi:hypothetical protein
MTCADAHPPEGCVTPSVLFAAVTSLVQEFEGGGATPAGSALDAVRIGGGAGGGDDGGGGDGGNGDGDGGGCLRALKRERKSARDAVGRGAF